MTTPDDPTANENRLRRWRLILGGGDADGTGVGLSGNDAGMDRALGGLYNRNDGAGGSASSGDDRRGGLGSSAPSVARWLGDIRGYFPSTVVRVMQQDALEQLNLRQLLLEPELLETVEADVHLVADLISLGKVIPNRTKDTARIVVRKVVDELMKKLENPLRQAITGSLNRAARNRRPRHNEINWQITIRRNLKHYQPDYRTIIPEVLIGYGRKRTQQLRDIILCIDQSGSMATSVVYASILGAVMASIPSVRTHLVVFDTSVVDLTPELSDPVEVLFGTQLGGGTDINRALGYCQTLIERPQDTIFVLISDLFEGGDRESMLQRIGQMVNAGVQFITLLALNDEGAPMYDHQTAGFLAELGSPAFACTPDQFPDLMAAAISRRDLTEWAAANDIVMARGAGR